VILLPVTEVVLLEFSQCNEWPSNGRL